MIFVKNNLNFQLKFDEVGEILKAIKKKFGVQQKISEVGKITRIFEIISGIF